MKDLKKSNTLIHYKAEASDEGDNNADNCPLYLSPVQAGFPSPGDDYIDEQLNLHHYMVKNAPATFFLKASGQSMIDIGIYDGDLLVVDRSLEVYNGRIVIASIDNELTVKKFVRHKEKTFLMPANDEFNAIEITEQESVFIWGVVTYAIHKFR